MNSDNDNTEISSSNSCNPGPSTPAETLIDRNILNPSSTTDNGKDDHDFTQTNSALKGDAPSNKPNEDDSQDLNASTSTLGLTEIVENVANIATESQQNEQVNNISCSVPSLSFVREPVPVRSLVQRCQSAPCDRVASEVEINITPPPIQPHVIHGPPPLAGAPPSYSAVMRIGPLDPAIRGRPLRIQPSPPFIAPIPPPSYGEVQGCLVERTALVASVFPTFSAEQMVWGPDPLSVICPRCANVVITSTQSQRSTMMHFSALALCLCGCWPCCLLPYCMDSCKNTYHHCPSCQQFLGMYRPW